MRAALAALAVLLLTLSEEDQSNSCDVGLSHSACHIRDSSVDDLRWLLGAAACDWDREAEVYLATDLLGDKELECLFGKLYLGGTGFSDDGKSPTKAAPMLTYGEFSPSVFSRLMVGPGLLDIGVTAEDTFADLGSGTGKLPFVASLLGVRSSLGVELARHRHDIGATAAKVLSQLAPGSRYEMFDDGSHASLELRLGKSRGRRLDLWAGSLLDIDLSNVSIVYAASLCFPDDLMVALADRLRAELHPGALFWTLKELPAGRHIGLARVRAVPGAASWDPHAKIIVYVRVPEIVLPQPPRLENGRSRERDAMSLWAVRLVEAAKAEFDSLRKSIGTEEARITSADFGRAARVFGASTLLVGRRLFQAFGSRGFRDIEGEDRCGCARADASMEWSFSEINMLEMLGHGSFPANESDDHSCLSLTRSCSLADLFAERVYLELRSQALCQGPDPPRSCGLRPVPGGLASDPGLRRSHFCARFSDGRTLLHVAVVGKTLDLGAMILQLWGHGAMICSDEEGKTILHIAAERDSFSVLRWLSKEAAALPGLGMANPLPLQDLAGRSPKEVARQSGTLEAFQAAFATETDRDASGSAT